MNSIRRYLVIVLLAAVALINFIAALNGYETSMTAANKVFDDKLSEITEILINSGAIENRIVSKIAQKENEKSIAFQVWQDEQIVQQSVNSPVTAIAPLSQGFHDVNFKGYRWRALSTQIKNSELESETWVIVAERTDVRFSLAESVVVESLLPIILCLPLIGLIIWLVVRRGLKPLASLATQLSDKRSEDLTPIAPEFKTAELSQLVSSANNLMSRLGAAIDREKRFASHAAHELRTPISALKVHLFNLQQELGNKNSSLTHLAQGIDRLGHLVEQILLLHKTSIENFASQFETLNAYELLQSSISECFDIIDKKAQTVELTGCKDLRLNGEKFALSAMLNNLIINASKYTPERGKIQISLLANHAGADDKATIVIEDSGPGIDPQEYDRVFERFYRVGGDQHASGEPGCGLGLAIVKHIADLHQAKIRLDKSANLGGLKVEILFSTMQRQQQ